MYDFDYARPTMLAEAVEMLKTDKDATPLAGGQTLLPTLRQRLACHSRLVDLSAISDLIGTTVNDQTLHIGAMTTHAAIAANKNVKETIPAIAKLASLIGDPQVRHRGTIGGSLANNDPAADWPAAILSLSATIETDRREIPAETYFQGLFKTALESSEIICAIRFPIPEKAGYAKFEQRASRFALVGVFVAKGASGVRVAVTGAGENGIYRAKELETRLATDFSAIALEGIKMDSAGLNSDLHANAEYRAALIPVMAERAVETAE